DAGKSWNLIRQGQFPVAIRETGRGVYYTDRDLDPGVMFSNDTGKTWVNIATTVQALGIDFMNDAVGFVSSQATSTLCPHLLTTDSGKTWQSIAATSEAWTPYADPVTQTVLLASERDPLKFVTQTAVLQCPISTGAENRLRTYSDSGLTGGIAGSHVCRSVIYVQGRLPATFSPMGIIRTMDGGATWKFVGGPSNINDKRFAVTGRGAVVIAFDNAGTVWRTTDGGDGTLSPSVLPFTSLAISTDSVRSTLCDSATAAFVVTYHACDSIRIASVSFTNDTLQELHLIRDSFPFVPVASSDTVKIEYTPKRAADWTADLRVTIEQSDGAIEDTTLTFRFTAFSALKGALAFSTLNATGAIAFDSASLCSSTLQTVTIRNAGCGPLTVDSLELSRPEFSRFSQFHPFELDPGDTRTFLIQCSPDTIGKIEGTLVVLSSEGIDSVKLIGKGFATVTSLSIVVPVPIVAPQCDSISFAVAIQNLACKAFAFDSITVNAPFRVVSIPNADSIHPGETAQLELEFAPDRNGPDTGSLALKLSYSGSGVYDTTVSIVATGSTGSARFAIASDSLEMGTVLICAEAWDTLWVHSSGCAPISLSAVLGSSAGFSMVHEPVAILVAGDSDFVAIHFQPGTTLGTETTDLILTTNVGNDTIPVSATVTASGGKIALSVPQNLPSFTCQSKLFSFSIANGLCDSVVVTKFLLGGNDPQDFSLSDTLPLTLSSQSDHSFQVEFSPSDTSIRSATIQISMQELNGTVHDTVLTINAIGLAVPPIEVAFGVTNFSAGIAQTVTIPIVAKHGSTTGLARFNFTLRLNTDLLTPLSIDANGAFGNASIKQISAIGKDSASFELEFPQNTVLDSGELCEIVCQPFVTTVTSTPIDL
ncbi:MAG TPA: choice-of-anchor D domain-containing protein, partial [Candidatus Kapabacteria bacterium]